MDLESTNGTTLNGEKVDPARYIEIKVSLQEGPVACPEKRWRPTADCQLRIETSPYNKWWYVHL